jgi:hypothetical protein
VVERHLPMVNVVGSSPISRLFFQTYCTFHRYGIMYSDTFFVISATLLYSYKALTVMSYLLSLGLSFEISVQILAILRDRESWLFGESLEPTQSKRWAILLRLKGYSPALVDFDRDVVLNTIEEGGGAIDLASDQIHEWLQIRLKKFKAESLHISL